MAIQWLLSARRFATVQGAFIPLFFLAAAAPDSCTAAPSPPGPAPNAPSCVHDPGTAGSGSVSCVNAPGVSPTATDLDQMSALGTFWVRIVAAEPNPPAKQMNSWTIRIYDTATRTAITGASVVATPYMDCHGHPARFPAQVTANPDGTYTVSQLDLFMAGIWRISISLPDRQDRVNFHFCVQG